jgi:serine/threonine-protein kinase
MKRLSANPHKDEAESRVGTRLGHYALKGIIGRGGMGVVYDGEHIYIRKRVAVKVLSRHFFDNQPARDRFLQEAQAASLIEHPNIVAVTDFGEAPDGTIFLVMSHVEGEPMERVLRRDRRLPLFRTIVILSQVARALGAAHAKGVIHRDLKPENIMLARRSGRREIVRTVADARGNLDIVEPEGEFDYVTVVDFGAAKIWNPRDANVTEGGVVIATPQYMAPETAHRGVADARADVYALGVIFYRALTGTLPFDGKDPSEIMVKHVADPVETPRYRCPDAEITLDTERVILRALEKDPARRQQTMEEFYADLQRCFGRVRFRRVSSTAPEDLDEFATAPPSPIPLMRPKRATPAAANGTPVNPVAAVAVTAPMPADGSKPLLLTKRKSDRHKTLPFGESTPVPSTTSAPAVTPLRTAAPPPSHTPSPTHTPKP